MISIFHRIIICLIFILLFTFCKNSDSKPETSEQKQIAEVVARARRATGSSPGQALALCDTAEVLARTHALTDSFDLKIAYARASAVATMGMPDSAFGIVSRMYEQKKNWPDTAAIVRILYNMGWYSYTGGHIPAAENYISRTISLMERANIVKNRANYMTLYADILRDRGKFTEAQDCLFRAVRIAEALNDTFALGMCYKGIGHVYVGINNMDKALEYYRKAYQSFEELNDREYSLPVLTNIALSYRKSKPDSSLYYYKLALAADSMNSNVRNKVMTLFNMGNVFLDLGQMEEARSCYDEVFDICQKNGIVSGISRVYCGYGSLESSKGNWQKAEEYYKKALELVRQSEENGAVLEVMKGLMDVYEQAGNWRNYAKLSVETKMLEDTLLGAAKRMQLQDIASTYSLEKKEMEKQYLSTLLEGENKRSNLWLSLFFISAIALVITLFFYLLNKRLKKGLEASYHILMEQYREEKKQREKAERELLDATQYTENTRKLLEYFNTQRAYLNPDLKYSDVTETLQLTYNELQAAIQELNFPNFKALLNQYRVQKVVLKFEDPAFDHYTIEAIAKDAGFGSRAAFYVAFETIKGVKPTFYRSQINLPAHS
jgi:tetratricopeptide (TPR) repeat protein